MVYRAPKQDPNTGATVSIIEAHYKLHIGEAFSCHYNQTVSDTNDRTIIAFRTANSKKYAHCTFTVYASTAGDAYMWEAPTITNNTGDSLTVFNRRRVGTPTETTMMRTNTNPDEVGAMYFTEATMGEVTSGTELTHYPLVAGTGPFTIGGSARNEQEWILKPNTLYAFEIKSSNMADNVCWIEVDWYENEVK